MMSDLFRNPLLIEGALGDGCKAVVWLMVTSAALLSAFRWARRLFPADGIIELLGHTTVLFWATIVASATVLGACRTLTGDKLLLTVAAIAGVTLVLAQISDASRHAPPLPSARPDRVWVAVWCAVFAYWMAHVAIHGVLSFPVDWDSLAYHLPLVNHWLQAKTLNDTGCARWSNPGNNELITLWAVGFFSGDYYYCLTNIPAAVLLACAFLTLCDRVGLSRPLAQVGAWILTCNYVFLKQLVDCENDVAVAGLFLATVGYALRASSGAGSMAGLLLGAMSIGLLAGVKYYALGYASLVALAWICLALYRQGVRPAARCLLVAVLGILAFGSYWYLRNYYLAGSPFYPKTILLKQDTLQLIYPDVARTSFLGNRDPDLLPLYIKAVGAIAGPGVALSLMLLPVSLTWLGFTAACLMRYDARVSRCHRLWLTGLVIGAALLFSITPFAVEDDPGTLNQMHMKYCPVRYSLCFLSLTLLTTLVCIADCVHAVCAASAASSSAIAATVSRSIYGVAIAGTLGGLFRACRGRFVNQESVILTAACVFLTMCLVLVFLDRLAYRRKFVLCAAFLGSFVVAGIFTASLSGRWHANYAEFYDRHFDGYMFQCLADERPGRIICVLQQRTYPFFGSYREHRVLQPTYVPSADWIVDYCNKEKVEFVVVRLHMPKDGWRRFLWFDECLVTYPGAFSLMSNHPDYTLFRTSVAGK